MKTALDILHDYWGYDDFRDLQSEIISAVLDNNNVLSLLPTGAGKSLCFQIPALMNEGVCIVITPLIALMEDQVKALGRKNIKAIALTSKYSQEESITAFDNLRFGNYKFLYLSPEKLQSEFIQQKIKQLKVNLIAIDEAHCISEWGHDFRPAYLKIPVLKELKPNVKFIALTATATSRVMEDIIDNLALEDVKIFRKSFQRTNLAYHVVQLNNPLNRLLQILKRTDEPAIVYCSSRKKSVAVSKYLNQNNINSVYYHGGMHKNDKSTALRSWMEEVNKVMVGTTAFGMGIDKENVRVIIHLDIPMSIENYQQETGRAGRDKNKAFAFLLYNEGTIEEFESLTHKRMVSPEYVIEFYAKLNQFFRIAKGDLPDKSFALDLQELCKIYELSIVKTFSAIGVLEKEGVIRLNQNFNSRSNLKILAKNNSMLSYEKNNPSLYKVLKIVLRSYGGGFDQFITIDETFIAKKSQLSKAETVRSLILMEKDGIISYNKFTNDIQIEFLVPRDKKFVMGRISKNLKRNNKVMLHKSRKILSYVENREVCRNILIMDYFGEKIKKPCGNCDVCVTLKNRKEKVSYGKIAELIELKLSKSKAKSLEDLVDELSLDDKIVIKTLRLMIEKNAIRLTSQNKIIKN